MPSLPLSFIVAFLLLILLLRFSKMLGTHRQYWSIYIFLLLLIGMKIVVGFRWSSNHELLRTLQPLLAVLLPSLTWYLFNQLRNAKPARWLHSLPLLLMLGAWQYWHEAVDVIIVFTYLAYGFALISLALKTPDQWVMSRFDALPFLNKAAATAGILFMISGLVDTIVAFDFAWYQGQHASTVIATLHALMIVILGWVIAWMGYTTPPFSTNEAHRAAPKTLKDEAVDPDPQQALDYQLLIKQLDSLLRTQALYCDPDLSLNRLARKLGIPARTVSAAVNSVLSCNVSQLINAYRVECITQQLDQSEQSITEIMGNCGFQTKSNFNREFRRLTGMNPSEWRKRAVKTPFEMTKALTVSKTD
ncbi:helix-turn-helix domain-containing protein [Thiolinea disciformis]|uniref:helix-turn-helix domain-containing protein n=1 Tax=Thiolinea disciformis TaxID=125614 RepID=UPI000376DFC6|nr:AraC family transcriptional regulator [Thiolinea disciformis]